MQRQGPPSCDCLIGEAQRQPAAGYVYLLVCTRRRQSPRQRPPVGRRCLWRRISDWQAPRRRPLQRRALSLSLPPSLLHTHATFAHEDARGGVAVGSSVSSCQQLKHPARVVHIMFEMSIIGSEWRLVGPTGGACQLKCSQLYSIAGEVAVSHHLISPCRCMQRRRRRRPCMPRPSVHLYYTRGMQCIHTPPRMCSVKAIISLPRAPSGPPMAAANSNVKLEQSTASVTRSSISARFCRSSVSDAELYSLMP